MEVRLDECEVCEIKGRRAWAKNAAILDIEIRDQKGRVTAFTEISRDRLEKLRDDIDYILESTKDVAGKAD